MRATKVALGCDPELDFHVPEEVYEAFDARERGARAPGGVGAADRPAGAASTSSAAAEWDSALAGRPLAGSRAMRCRASSRTSKLATRVAAGKAMQAFAPFVPTMLGGSADLAASVNTAFKARAASRREHAGRNVHCGVREHAMGAAVNGLALHGGIVRPYGSTFLQFADYMRPAIRLSALMGLRVVWIFSHDSVGLGEDGPTHQPIEHLAALRAIPGLTVIRPATRTRPRSPGRRSSSSSMGPACLVLSRQELPVLDRRSSRRPTACAAAPTCSPTPGEPDAGARRDRAPRCASRSPRASCSPSKGIEARVVSMPSFELFAAQDEAYRDSVLPPGTPTVSVEAGVAQGWERWVDASVSIERFGASAPGRRQWLEASGSRRLRPSAVRGAAEASAAR